MKDGINNSWKKVLHDEFDKPYFKELSNFVNEEYKNQVVFPPANKIFSAFNACPFEDVKVVIIGQDPYHGEGQANGMCFSVAKGLKIPPSLRNIYKELASDVKKEIPKHGDLSHWAAQGVLLLNATLTVRKSIPGSHQKKGWETFTDAVILRINEDKQNVIFLLWGAYAQNKGKIIDSSKHHILQSPHPSPFSAHRGFLGNKHFSKCNEFLKNYGMKGIDW